MSDLPGCAKCGGVARPNILMFVDYDFVHDRVKKQKENLKKWFENIEEDEQLSKICVIEIGAGLSVPTVRIQSESIPNATLIRINLNEAQVPSPEKNVSIPLRSNQAIHLIDECLKNIEK